MPQPTLHEIITAHTDALAAHSEEFLPTIRLLLLMGAGPVSPERLATAMRWTPLTSWETLKLMSRPSRKRVMRR